MENNKITEIVTYEQLQLLEILNKIGVLKIVHWYKTDEIYYVVLESKTNKTEF